ncbi:hypothetical protein KAH55_07410 [bacterium]|nr:hypothetical protein [bacterium]
MKKTVLISGLLLLALLQSGDETSASADSTVDSTAVADSVRNRRSG